MNTHARGCVGQRLYDFAITEDVIRRLDRYEPNGLGCWIWQGAKSGSGYARISINGRLYMAHRVAYIAWKDSELHPDLDLDHLCRVRACINPFHLEAVTRSVNLQRAERKTPGAVSSVGEALETAPGWVGA